MGTSRPLAAEGRSRTGNGDDLSAPGAPGGRRADIQGLRALAVLMVVAFHAGLSVSGGFTGVDVFFVISGFVITAMLLRELVGHGGLSFREFYARRVRRILPASALMISVVTLASIAAIGPSSQHQTARTGQAGSLFVANVLLARARNGYFDLSPTGNPLLHVWSLSVEEQFYLVFPAILLVGFLMARRRFPRTDARRVVGSVVGVVAVASFGLSWYATTRVGGFSGPGSSLLSLFMSGQTRAQASQVAFYVAPARAWEFAVGSLLALGVPWISRLPRRVATVAGLAGAALILVAAFGISSTTPFPGTAALVPVVGAALLLVAGTVSTNWISSLLSTAPFARLGDLSYSWYLWHWPMIVFALALFPMEDHAALIAAALSLIPAWASFRYLENPVRRNSRIRGRTAVAVAAVCVVVPLACSFVLMRAPQPSASATTRAFLQASNRGHADQARGCNRGVALNALPARCTFSVPDARGRIVLLGDSNAGQFAEPASQAATRSGFDLTIGTYPDCPFVDLVVASVPPSQHEQRCRRFVSTTLRQLVSTKPNLVFLAASVPLYLTSAVTFRDPSGGPVATSAAAKARLWSVGLRRVLKTLSDAGVPTVVVHTIPHWSSWDSRECAEIRVYLAPRSCGTDQTLAEVAAYRHESLAADDRALRAMPDAVGVDFISDLCRASGCATNRGNHWLYRDGRHLSVVGALGLTGRFEDLIRANARAWRRPVVPMTGRVVGEARGGIVRVGPRARR